MTPLPGLLGSGEIHFWRLDIAQRTDIWNRGEGSFRVGGRWNSAGVRTVYAALDPATAILEVAVHLGFKMLDTVAHTLTSARLVYPDRAYVVQPEDVPNPNWLAPAPPSAGQRAFGDDLLARHAVAILPSVVSTHSWNLIFAPDRAGGLYELLSQEPFALDPRLHPPV